MADSTHKPKGDAISKVAADGSIEEAIKNQYGISSGDGSEIKAALDEYENILPNEAVTNEAKELVPRIPQERVTLPPEKKQTDRENKISKFINPSDHK